MRVLLIHNSYRQRGGEDAVFEAERDLLIHNGCDVYVHHVSNDDILDINRMSLALKTLWNRDQYKVIQKELREIGPDVAHFHNTMPLVSPAGYYAAHRAHVPVVQTLHNYRLICPSALLFRDGAVCEECVGRSITTPAIRHRCYRDSRSATAAITAMLALHRARGTYQKRIDQYIALTDFAREKYIKGGLPADRITVKPNFLADDPGAGRGARNGALFVGRLTPEKGIEILLEAMRRRADDLQLTIIGDGPLKRDVMNAAAADARITYAGALDRDTVLKHMRKAEVLAFPSLWYEGMPMTIVEAYACGTPVLANDIGSMQSIVASQRTGRLLPPGDIDAWSKALFEPDLNLPTYGKAARAVFETQYSAQQNYAQLMTIYERVTDTQGPARRVDEHVKAPTC